ncbi:MAG: bifunctional riboflavin kinase/FAD synthetase [Bacteroidota bacterium]
MVITHSISEYDKQNPSVVTIGTFDGVHVGHRKILERLIKNAENLNLKSTVLTFFPHPRMVLQKDSDIKMLNTIGEKTKILEQLGLDQLIIHPFTREFSRLSATDFVRDVLVNSLGIKKIIIGYDHRFGRNRNANIQDLIAFGSSYDFEVEEIPAQEVDDVSVSSTKIRKALLEGDITTANTYLGYSYMFSGVVQKGKGLGKQLTFPTANIHIGESYKLIPKNGVYVVRSYIKGRLVHGMMNIGHNPTVSYTDDSSTDRKERIEVHFFDFEGDLYGQTLEIQLMERIRNERKFESLEALKLQLQKDKETALPLISKP